MLPKPTMGQAIALRLLAALLLALAMAGAARAESARVALQDSVPGQTGVTYLDLVRLALPDIKAEPDIKPQPEVKPKQDIEAEPETSTVYVSKPPRDFRHIVPDYAADPTPQRAVLLDAIALPVVSGGKPRLLLLLDFGEVLPDDVGYALMALYGFDTGPQLLDIVNVTMGHQSHFMFPDRLDVGSGQTAVVITGFIQVEVDSINEMALVLARNDRLELVHDISILSHHSCAANFNQNPDFSVSLSARLLQDIKVVITETLEPTNAECDGETSPEAATRATTVTYRWNLYGARYEPDSDAFEKMREETLKRY